MLRIQALLLSLALSTTLGATISPGSALYASNTNQAWFSPNNTFSLRFVLVQPPTSPPSFIAAIVYSGGAPTVWYAGNGVSVNSGGSFHFLSSGSLRLVNGSGVIVWDSGTSKLGVSSASLEDNGNLVLSNGTSAVWSSFNHPTDTIVPSQNFTIGMVLRSGPYSFTILKPCNLTLRWNDSVPYWDHGLNSSINAKITSPVLEMQSMGMLQLIDPNLMTPVLVAYSSDHGEGNNILRILKLDGDGNLRIFSFSRGSATVRWTAVADECKVFGYCGNYGICSYNGSIPICGCPSQNFETIDPNDSRKGCRRKVRLEDCPESPDGVAMLQLDHAQFLTYPPQLLINPDVLYIPLTACRGDCLSAGSCFASTSLSDGTGLCYMKTANFISGYQNPALPSTSYVKVCGPLAPNPRPSLEEAETEKNWRIRAWIIVALILGTLLASVAFEGGLWLWCYKNRPISGSFYAESAHVDYVSGGPVQFSYKELQRLTNGFKDKLGAVGFGTVYRGILANKTTVAVKQLEGIEQGEKQFRLEVASISSTHHLNLVRLIGFCSEGHHRLLVYEFMKNGSLDNFLFVKEGQPEKLLDWEYRFKIVLGIAKGITYLHEECPNCVVHCNIKPENILLDENHNVKLSDFGLGKLRSVRGTSGYLAPEWFANVPITSKSDVYSYGMVLLEIVGGRRSFEVSEETNRKRFSVWACEEFEKGNIEEIIDKRLIDAEFYMEQVKRVILTSFWCIQEQPSLRPKMGKVVQMLEGSGEIERPPTPKFMTEGFVNETGMHLCSNASAVSTVAAAAPACLSFSS